jgi:hypothetical protein
MLPSVKYISVAHGILNLHSIHHITDASIKELLLDHREFLFLHRVALRVSPPAWRWDEILG